MTDTITNPPTGSMTGPGMDGMTDIDPTETEEWLEALGSVLEFEGGDRAHYLLDRLIEEGRQRGAPVPYSTTTPYINTIPVEKQPPYPGDLATEWRIRSMNRWNAIAMVLRANKESSELGGHIASFQSAATLYDVGWTHFWRGVTEDQPGDLIFFQGHSAPGFYARAYMEDRLTEEQLDNFRQEAFRDGLPS